MTLDPKFLAERNHVDAWIASELDVALHETAFGRALHESWRSSSPAIGEFLAARFETFPGGGGTLNAVLVDALRTGDAGSYYKALLMQALVLVQAADRGIRGTAEEKIRITFLPSNTRYAAIYEPHMAKGWSVIGIDWGLLCVLMMVAAVVSRCVQGTFDPQNQSMTWHLTPENAIAHFDAHPELGPIWVEGLTPAIIPSHPPAPPMFGTEPHQAAFGLRLLKAMIFGLVAHEYGHAIRNHLQDERRATELRFQIEHEADAMAILLAMADPWKTLTQSTEYYDPQERTFTVAACLLLLSVLKMLQTGDRMVDDLTGRQARVSTHPDPMERLLGLRQVIDLLVPRNTMQRRQIDMHGQVLMNLLDAIWNRNSRALFAHLQRQNELAVRPPNDVSGGALRFL